MEGSLDPEIEGKVPKIKEGAIESQVRRVENLITPIDFRWDEAKLQDLCDQEIVEAINRVKIYGSEIEDKLFWISTNNGFFSVKSCYNILTSNGASDKSIWKEIWTAKIHERIKMFLWRLAADVLPLKGTIFESTGKGDPSCSFCGFTKEMSSHLLVECPVARAMAFSSKWGLRLDSVASSNAQELVKWCMNPSHQLCSNLGRKDYTSLLLATFLYIIWELRNDKVYENRSSIAKASARWESMVEEFKLVALGKKSRCHPRRDIVWKAPQSGRICITRMLCALQTNQQSLLLLGTTRV